MEAKNVSRKGGAEANSRGLGVLLTTQCTQKLICDSPLQKWQTDKNDKWQKW